MVSTIFHSLFRCFSPFPHGTGSLSITREYLALGDGPPRFRRNFTCSAVLRIHSREEPSFDYGVMLHHEPFQAPSPPPRSFVTPYRCLQPQEASLLVWAMFRFARRYSGNRICFLFLQALDVSVPWVCLLTLCIQVRIPYHYVWWVSPFKIF